MGQWKAVDPKNETDIQGVVEIGEDGAAYFLDQDDKHRFASWTEIEEATGLKLVAVENEEFAVQRSHFAALAKDRKREAEKLTATEPTTAPAVEVPSENPDLGNAASAAVSNAAGAEPLGSSNEGNASDAGASSDGSPAPATADAPTSTEAPTEVAA